MLTWLTLSASPRPLGLARIVVGIAALIRTYVAWRILIRLTDDHVLRAPYFDWLPDPSVTVAVAIVVVWAISAVLFMLGWRVGLTGPLLLASIVAYLAIDQQTYSNHLYLMAWLVFLMTLADAGAGLTVQRADRPIARWGALLIMMQLSIVYGFAGLTKINRDFLSGEVLAGVLNGGLVSFPETLRNPRFLSILSGLVIIVEIGIALLIWRRRFRPWVFLTGLGLHVSITLVMSATLELLVFSLEMLALYPLFLDRDRLTLVWDDECSSCRDWMRRLTRLDVLRSVDTIGKSDPTNPVPAGDVERSLHLIHANVVSKGFRAVTLTLEHLVPTLWVAPILRLPGISHAAERWYRWQARRRSCLVGARIEARAPGPP